MNKLNTLKKNDKAFRLMSRYNPQLGTYYVWTLVDVDKITKSSVFVKAMVGAERYNINTRDLRRKSQSIYGSTTYSLYTLGEAKVRNEELVRQGNNVRGFKD